MERPIGRSHPLHNRLQFGSSLSAAHDPSHGLRKPLCQPLRQQPAINCRHAAPFGHVPHAGGCVFYAILATWAILTVIGILRLRPWARYSILIIGGGLAGIGTLHPAMPTFGAFCLIVYAFLLSLLHRHRRPSPRPQIAPVCRLFPNLPPALNVPQICQAH
jgi:hypothetical protein